MIERRGDRCFLTGDLTHNEVASLLNEGVDFPDKGPVIVDLAGVRAVDSSALSLMLEWMRRASTQNAKVIFTNLRPELRSLIDLYGISDVIPLAS